MMAALKSEFRKLLTIRSTYILSLLVVALTVFFGLYVKGINVDRGSLADPNMFMNDIFILSSIVSTLGAIVAILMVTHEYRYNMIMYTLTASNNRLKIVVAKFVTITVYSLILSAVVIALGLAMVHMGLNIKHFTPVPQTMHYGNLIWRVLFYGWSTAVVGLLLAMLLRNQVATIASTFLIPTAEQLLSLLLKTHSTYLPFMSKDAVLSPPEARLGAMTPAHGAEIFTLYLIVGWIAASILFVRRDAN